MNSNILEYDIQIIGASLSGAVSAYLLGRAGFNVLLLDPQSFPRQKACGEGMSNLGKQYLEAIGLWPDEIDNQLTLFTATIFSSLDGRKLELSKYSDSAPQGYGVSRIKLDSYVHNAALALPNVNVVNARVTDLKDLENKWQITTTNNQIIQSRDLILACGGAGLSKLLPFVRTKESKNARFGMAFWAEGSWADKLPRNVQIYNRPEGQFIITPLSPNKINFSMLLNRRHASNLTGPELQERAIAIARENGFLINSSTKLKGAAAIHSSRVYPQNLRSYIIGDAVERFDPIGGIGMTNAIYSALLASTAISNQCQSDKVSNTESIAWYYKQREKGARILRSLTYLSSKLNIANNLILKNLSIASPKLTEMGLSLLKPSFQHQNLVV